MKVVRVVLEDRVKYPNQNFRIVLLSSDADFKPTVEFLLEEKIAVEVWAWKVSIGTQYELYLRGLMTQSRPRVLYYLDHYLYQVGYDHTLVNEYMVAFNSFPHREFESKDDEVRKKAENAFNHCTQFNISDYLLNRAPNGKFNTRDFFILWSKGTFRITFRTKEDRDEFNSLLKKPKDNLPKRLSGVLHIDGIYVKHNDSRSRSLLKEWVAAIDNWSQGQNDEDQASPDDSDMDLNFPIDNESD